MRVRANDGGLMLPGALILTTVLILLSGCTSTPEAASQSTPVISHGAGAIPLPTAQEAALTAGGTFDGSAAAWGPDGQILVMTFGSSSCPRLPTVVELVDSHTLKISTAALLPPADPGVAAACTADAAPTTSAVAIPAGLDVASAVTVVFDGVPQVLPAKE